jgi:hypothetical protein
MKIGRGKDNRKLEAQMGNIVTKKTRRKRTDAERKKQRGKETNNKKRGKGKRNEKNKD